MSIDTRLLLSETKFYESYSRYNDELGRYETWNESVDRVMNMHKEYYSKFSNELSQYFDFVTGQYKNKKILGAQRALQYGGEQLFKHQMRMYNCVSSYCDRSEFFGEYFYVLLCGSGAGFSVQRHHVQKLPNIIQRTKQPKIHIVEDSIEGWATALDVLMSSYFENGGKYPEYKGHRIYFDLSKIRPRGSLISGGFKAPGPDPLRLSLDRIEHILQGIVLNTKKAQLKPIQVYDICMHIADSVLAGGVRRSATICIFSPDDEEMINAKTGSWFITNPQRARSNNSALIVRNQIDKESFDSIMSKIKQFGEPGFIFADSTEQIFNPCVEIGMFPQLDGESGWQGCNLTEINGSACSDEQEFYDACRAASILGTLQAGYTDFKFLTPISKKIFDREALLGVSITGWMANPKLLFDDKVLQNGAKIVLETNKEIAKIIGINPSARSTCAKPSGNASVLLMTPSGIHPEHSPRYFRNIQLNKDTEVAKLLLEKNPHMVEESVWSASNSDYIVSFPIVSKPGSLFKDDLMGVKHLELVKKAQQNWVEYGTDVELCVDKTVRHNISNTIIVDDWDSVANYVFENRKYFSGISFLSQQGDKIFNQAPNTKVLTAEEIFEEYGLGSLFASGLITDGLNCFDNLWVACDTAKGYGEKLNSDDSSTLLKRDWVRRFENFSNNYFSGNMDRTEYCLKDLYLLHKWEKICQNLNPVDWINDLTSKKFVDADTMSGAACYAGSCEL